MPGLSSIRVLLLSALAVSCSPAGAQDPIQEEEDGVVASDTMSVAHEIGLRQGLRELWADHVIRTRDYIIAVAADHPSAETALERLMANQEDLGDAIAPYYGRPAGDSLTTLLKGHIRIAGEVVAAARAANGDGLASADRRWHENAEQIATFLSGANPSWGRADLIVMLDEHLALTTQEATARLQSAWSEDGETFDRIFDQAMMMADTMAEGILEQFPEGTSSLEAPSPEGPVPEPSTPGTPR